MKTSPWEAPAANVAVPVPVEDDDDVMPWLDIWFRPAPTMRYLLRVGSFGSVLLIAAVHGAVTSNTTGVDALTEWVLRGTVGPVAGVLSLLLLGLVTWGIGRMFNGTGAYADVVAALAWGGLPYTVASAILLGLSALSTTLAMPLPDPVLYGLLGVSILGWVWGFVWQVVTVAEAHRFGWFESFVTVGAPWLAFLGCIGMFAAMVLGAVV